MFHLQTCYKPVDNKVLTINFVAGVLKMSVDLLDVWQCVGLFLLKLFYRSWIYSWHAKFVHKK